MKKRNYRSHDVKQVDWNRGQGQAVAAPLKERAGNRPACRGCRASLRFYYNRHNYAIR